MLHYEECLVSFIDILGFRSLVAERPADEIYQIIKSLEKFTQPFDHGQKSRSMDEVRLYSRAFAHAISDAIVRVRPFWTQYRDGALAYELLDLLHAQIDLINSGILIRAGMSIGQCHAGFDGEGPFFGPALIRAYEIECNEASYPRIIIDGDVLEAHRSVEQLRGEHNTLKYEISFITRILKKDADGKYFIDYLANHSEFDDLGSYFKFLQTHADLIRIGLIRNSGNPHILSKYEWLKDYHNIYVNKWVESTTKDATERNSLKYSFEVDPDIFFASVLIK